MRASEVGLLILMSAMVGFLLWPNTNRRDEVDNRRAEAKLWRDVRREQCRLEDQGRRENWRDLQPMFAAIRKERARQAYLAKVGEQALREHWGPLLKRKR